MNVLVQRKKIKRLTLRVVDENTLSVSAPYGFSTANIDIFIKENTSWIQKKVSEIKMTKMAYATLYSLDQILLDGKLLTVYKAHAQRSFVTDEGVFIADKYYNEFDKRRKELIRIIKKQADIRLRAAVSEAGTALGLCPKDIIIKFIRGKRIWGKCDADKRITIDSRAVMLNITLQKYIILHEFAHLAVFDHSKRFWQVVEKHVPNYKICKKELNQYSFLRDIYY